MPSRTMNFLGLDSRTVSWASTQGQDSLMQPSMEAGVDWTRPPVWLLFSAQSRALATGKPFCLRSHLRRIRPVASLLPRAISSRPAPLPSPVTLGPTVGPTAKAGAPPPSLSWSRGTRPWQICSRTWYSETIAGPQWPWTIGGPSRVVLSRAALPRAGGPPSTAARPLAAREGTGRAR
jgi:hypothetical protein